MKDAETPTLEKRYMCRRTQKWLDDGKVREKQEFFRLHREDADRPATVTRRERIVTFYTRLRGRHRLDNELWYTTNDPAERDRLRTELKEYLVANPGNPTAPR